jgi:hypothetical protein
MIAVISILRRFYLSEICYFSFLNFQMRFVDSTAKIDELRREKITSDNYSWVKNRSLFPAVIPGSAAVRIR